MSMQLYNNFWNLSFHLKPTLNLYLVPMLWLTLASLRLFLQHHGKPTGKWEPVQSTCRLLFLFNQFPSQCSARHRHLHSQSKQRESASASNSTAHEETLSRIYALTDDTINHVKKALRLLKERYRLQGPNKDFVSLFEYDACVSSNLPFLKFLAGGDSNGVEKSSRSAAAIHPKSRRWPVLSKFDEETYNILRHAFLHSLHNHSDGRLSGYSFDASIW